MRKKTIETATITATPRSFYLVLWSLPLLLLLALEFGLRWGGFGASYPLFIPAPEAGYLQPNPLLVRRYVDDPRQAPPVFSEAAGALPGMGAAAALSGSHAKGSAGWSLSETSPP